MDSGGAVPHWRLYKLGRTWLIGNLAAVFFDFAFDTVLPSYILHLLYHLLYLQSFLSLRPFQVRIRHITSPTFFFHSGTPQGSVLSPFSFP
jgi:hypothetical protein